MSKLTKNLLLKIITEEAKKMELGLGSSMSQDLDLGEDPTQQIKAAAQQQQNISKFTTAASNLYAAMKKFSDFLEEMKLQSVKDKMTGDFTEMMDALHDMVKDPKSVEGLDAQPTDLEKPKVSKKIVLKPSKPTGKTL